MYHVQLGATFQNITIVAQSSAEACTIDKDSYQLTRSINGTNLESNGLLSINSTLVYANLAVQDVPKVEYAH